MTNTATASVTVRQTFDVLEADQPSFVNPSELGRGVKFNGVGYQNSPQVTIRDGGRYLLGALLRDSHWWVDFIPKREGFHLCYTSTRYSPATVYFHMGDRVHSLDAKEAVKSLEFMDYLDSYDRKEVERLSSLVLSKPDYSKWVFRAED